MVNPRGRRLRAPRRQLQSAGDDLDRDAALTAAGWRVIRTSKTTLTRRPAKLAGHIRTRSHSATAKPAQPDTRPRHAEPPVEDARPAIGPTPPTFAGARRDETPVDRRCVPSGDAVSTNPRRDEGRRRPLDQVLVADGPHDRRVAPGDAGPTRFGADHPGGAAPGWASRHDARVAGRPGRAPPDVRRWRGQALRAATTQGLPSAHWPSRPSSRRSRRCGLRVHTADFSVTADGHPALRRLRPEPYPRDATIESVARASRGVGPDDEAVVYGLRCGAATCAACWWRPTAPAAAEGPLRSSALSAGEPDRAWRGPTGTRALRRRWPRSWRGWPRPRQGRWAGHQWPHPSSRGRSGRRRARPARSP